MQRNYKIGNRQLWKIAKLYILLYICINKISNYAIYAVNQYKIDLFDAKTDSFI